jgi:hypothetical protein
VYSPVGNVVGSFSGARGLGGTNSSNGFGDPGVDGVLRLEGRTLFESAGGSIPFTPVSVTAGGLIVTGEVHFDFASPLDAAYVDNVATIDSFFAVPGGVDLGVFSGVTFTASAGTTEYAVTLLQDRTFDLTVIPEPSSMCLLIPVAPLTLRKRR